MDPQQNIHKVLKYYIRQPVFAVALITSSCSDSFAVVSRTRLVLEWVTDRGTLSAVNLCTSADMDLTVIVSPYTFLWMNMD